jgi:hypothetical protein
MAAVDFVRRDPRAVSHDSTHSAPREQAIVPAEEIPRANVGPRGQRPCLLARRVWLLASSRDRLGGEPFGNVMVEDRAIAGVFLWLLLVTGVAETSRPRTRPAKGSFPRPGPAG